MTRGIHCGKIKTRLFGQVCMRRRNKGESRKEWRSLIFFFPFSRLRGARAISCIVIAGLIFNSRLDCIWELIHLGEVVFKKRIEGSFVRFDFNLNYGN